MQLLMVGYIVGQAQYMLNDLPYTTGILTTMSARKSIEGLPNFDYNTMSLKLGKSVQLFEGTKNTQHSRSVQVFALNL